MNEKKIKEMLFDAVNDIIIKLQEENDITDGKEQDMTKKELFLMTLADIDDAVMDIFTMYQKRLGIMDGGLDPILENELCDMEHDIANHIAKCLIYQMAK